MIISCSGKICSGKDTVGSIIQYLTSKYYNEGKTYYEYLEGIESNSINTNNFEIKKFADKLKDIICILIGCSRNDLENQEFKSRELSEEWWKYSVDYMDKYDSYNNYFSSEKEADDFIVSLEDMCIFYLEKKIVKLTPRLLLQLMGTNCGRNIIHPNIWVLSLFSEYNETSKWIITDTRFVNEINVIKKYNGINIRINRDIMTSLEWSKRYQQIIIYANNGCDSTSFLNEKITLAKYKRRILNGTIKIENGNNHFEEHESETSLDNYQFDFVIDNNGTLDELIENVKEILIKCKIINE